MSDGDTAKKLFFDGLSHLDAHNFAAAETRFIETLKLAPRSIPTLNNLAIAQHKQDKIDEAAQTSARVIDIDPTNTDAYLMLANCHRALKLHQDALRNFEKVISIDPANADAHCGRGLSLIELKRDREALSSFDDAISVEPRFADGHLHRGRALAILKRYDEALAAYEAALVANPDLAGAMLGRGWVFAELRRYGDALAAYTSALALKPDLCEAWLGRGDAFVAMNQIDDALAAYEKALAIKPDLGEAWLRLGHVFVLKGSHKDALNPYDRALALGIEAAKSAHLQCKMHLCDWTDFVVERENLIASVQGDKTGVDPFGFLVISTSPGDQLKCARSWVARHCPASDAPLWNGEIYKHDRIRIAYVSADFRSHATSVLITGMIEGHNRERFDVVGISLQPEDTSPVGQRIKLAFDRFIDVSTLLDGEAANLIRELEIDIAIDLNGHTRNSRPNIFARRAAPMQVNYLGFPATTGADYIDYLIADRTLVPESCRAHYTEKIVYLPDSYQINDTRRPISDKNFTRAECNLPEKAFVFCCFNGNYKILPDVFDCWMRILRRVDGSVLWLLEDNEIAALNLKKAAAERGIDAGRLVFASRMPLPEHLARHRLAALFLDTLPCNAHTTASDALWAGLPVLTQIGETFAGRVAASVLNAVGLPELITATPQAYEDLAVEFAADSEKLAAIRAKLANNRLTKPLFDTRLFTRHIEAAYTAMYQRYQAGLPPECISVEE